MKFKFILLSIAALLFLSCSEELDISEFSGDFSGYEPELRIEAIILPTDSSAIVRIDRSILIDEAELYNCIDDDGDWEVSYYYCADDAALFESKSECNSDCIEECVFHLNDDLGTDGIDSNEPSGFVTQPDSDGSEGNGQPDCGEPHVDEYDEILPQIHVQDCDVQIVRNETDICNFIFDSLAADFFYTEGKHTHAPTMEDIGKVQYGAYVPGEDCDTDWRDFEGEYTFSAFCPSFSEFDTIRSKEPIRLSRPVIFYMESDHENMKSCDSHEDSHECLIQNSTISDTVYFAEHAPEQYLYYSSLLESSYYQAVQYHLDKDSLEYKITHEHPDQATDIENIWGNICLMKEKIITQIFDGNDDGIDEADISKYEIFTFSESFTNYYFFDMLDIRDPVRTNLRDQNGEGNPVMGTFGSMTSNEINLRIIDCEQFEGETECNENSKDVCQWFPDREACDFKIPE